MNSSEIYHMACVLLDESGYDRLTDSESWDMADHMTYTEIKMWETSQKLFELGGLLGFDKRTGTAPIRSQA